MKILASGLSLGKKTNSPLTNFLKTLASQTKPPNPTVYRWATVKTAIPEFEKKDYYLSHLYRMWGCFGQWGP